jgi:thiol-disulfide isomerase/thioredoxin
MMNTKATFLALTAALSLVATAQERKQTSIPAVKIKPMAVRPGPKGPGPEKMANKAAPTWKMTTIDGKTITGAGLKGKVVLIDFWATWCGPCKLASPIMQALHEKYGSKGLVVIGANTSERDPSGNLLNTPKLAADYRSEHKYTYTFTYGNDAMKNAWGVQGIPTMFIIDKQGIVKKVQVGYDDKLQSVLEAAIKPLL